MTATIPITILSGFLGTGKTTTLRHLLENVKDQKIGVIANDVASVNIDGKLVSATEIEQGGDKVVSVRLENGCLCCTAAGGLLESIDKLVNGDDVFDHIVIESTGVAEPKKVCQVFQSVEAAKLRDKAHLARMVTVVDCEHFWEFFSSGEGSNTLPTVEGDDEVKLSDGPQRMIVDLLTEQIECADTILVNKTDLVEPSVVMEIKTVLQQLNPAVQRISTMEFGKVAVEEILSSDKATSSAVAALCLSVDAQHHHDVAALASKMTLKEDAAHEAGGAHDGHHVHDHTGDHGHDHHDHDHHGHDHHDHDHHGHDHKQPHYHGDHICYEDHDNSPWSHFVYSSRKPFHGPALAKNVLQLMNVAQQEKRSKKDVTNKLVDESLTKNPFTAVVRSKGFVWLAQQHNKRLYWTHAGLHFAVVPQGEWWASKDKSEWPAGKEASMMEDFEEPFGDRRQEIVFIGCNMDEGKIRQLFDSALMDDDMYEGFCERHGVEV